MFNSAATTSIASRRSILKFKRYLATEFALLSAGGSRIIKRTILDVCLAVLFALLVAVSSFAGALAVLLFILETFPTVDGWMLSLAIAGGFLVLAGVVRMKRARGRWQPERGSRTPHLKSRFRGPNSDSQVDVLNSEIVIPNSNQSEEVVASQPSHQFVNTDSATSNDDSPLSQLSSLVAEQAARFFRQSFLIFVKNNPLGVLIAMVAIVSSVRKFLFPVSSPPRARVSRKITLDDPKQSGVVAFNGEFAGSDKLHNQQQPFASVLGAIHVGGKVISLVRARRRPTVYEVVGLVTESAVIFEGLRRSKR